MKNFLVGFLAVIYAVFVCVFLFNQKNIVNYLNTDNKARLVAFKAKNNQRLHDENEKVEQRQYKMSTVDNATITHHVDNDKNIDNYVVTGKVAGQDVRYEFRNKPSYNKDHGVDFYKYNNNLYTTKKLLIEDLKSGNETDADERYNDYHGSDDLDYYSTYDKETYTDRKDNIEQAVGLGLFLAVTLGGVLLFILGVVIMMFF